jgi:asparagine synthase (glutamine-hydrolysing)
MKFSIENRSPYLDYNLFNFAFSIPNQHLIKEGYGKYVLRKAVKGILNDQVRLDRKKLGFNASINSVLDFNNSSTIDYLLSDSPIFDIVNKNKFKKFIKKDFFENSHKKFLFNFINSKIFLEQNSNFRE